MTNAIPSIAARLSTTLLLGLFINASVGIATAGPISPLYLTGIAVRTDLPGCGTSINCPVNVNEVVVVQGTSVTNSWVTHTAGMTYNPADPQGPSFPDPTLQSGNEGPLAVGTTVRTLGADNYLHGGNPAGSEYTLGGSYTGLTFTNVLTGPAGSEQLMDGTRDASHNYAIGGSGDIYSFDLNWQNPAFLFSLPPLGSSEIWSGVAYDATNNSLWVSSFTSGEIEDFSLGGTLLSSFPLTFPPGAQPGASGLALDPGDQTLWTYFSGGGTFAQYSKSGALLSTQTYAALSTPNLWQNFGVSGAEFAYEDTTVPEPGVVFSTAIGLAILFLRRRRLPGSVPPRS